VHEMHVLILGLTSVLAWLSCPLPDMLIENLVSLPGVRYLKN
jgi:hypothetical protein